MNAKADVRHIYRPAIATVTRSSETGARWHFDEGIGGTFAQVKAQVPAPVQPELVVGRESH